MLQLLRLNKILKLKLGTAGLAKESTMSSKIGVDRIGLRTNLKKNLCLRGNEYGLKSRLYLGLSYFCFLFFLSFSCALYAATPIKKTVSFTEYLNQEKVHLISVIHDAKQTITLKNEKEYNAKIKQVSAILSMSRVKIESLESYLDHQDKEQNILNQRLKHLQQLPIAKADTTIPERVARVEYLLEANTKTTQLVTENLELAKEFRATLIDEIRHLESWHANFELEQKLEQIKTLKKELLKQLSTIYESNIHNPLDKHAKISPLSEADYEAKLLINNQSIAAIQNHINALNIQKTVVNADIIYLKNPDTKNLQLITDIYKESINHYSKIEKSLQHIENFLNQEAKLVAAPSLKKSINLLEASLSKQLKEANLQKKLLIKNLIEYQVHLKKLISSRQTLADYNINSWPIILNKIAAIPSL
ncbi:MAG: mechanosensitive ion channel protein MscS, partial [Legionella longbeachae]|nr:mechanosensitive ion channel protein MscS [Legionella longbeachae]